LSLKLLHPCQKEGGVLIGKSPIVSQARNHVVAALEEGGFTDEIRTTIDFNSVCHGSLSLSIISDSDSRGESRGERDFGAIEISVGGDNFDGTAANVDPDACAFELHMFFQVVVDDP
jgi:hypothetical protein